MSRYERDDSAGRACGLIRDRIRATPGFKLARELVLERAFQRVIDYDRKASVATLRRLGGLSAVVCYAIKTLPDLYRVDLGSKMFPSSVIDQLDAEVGELRSDLQQRLARFLHETA